MCFVSFQVDAVNIQQVQTQFLLCFAVCLASRGSNNTLYTHFLGITPWIVFRWIQGNGQGIALCVCVCACSCLPSFSQFSIIKASRCARLACSTGPEENQETIRAFGWRQERSNHVQRVSNYLNLYKLQWCSFGASGWSYRICDVKTENRGVGPVNVGFGLRYCSIWKCADNWWSFPDEVGVEKWRGNWTWWTGCLIKYVWDFLVSRLCVCVCVWT